MPTGLAANLDELSSYRFTESNAGSPAGVATASGTTTTGTMAAATSAAVSPSVFVSPSASPVPGNAGPSSASSSPAGSSSPSGVRSAAPSKSAVPSRSPAPAAPSASPASASPSASPSEASGAYFVSGTVINKPAASMWLSETDAQFILVGSQAWISADGATWTVSDANQAVLGDLLPGHDYATWFDAKSTYFVALGTESKNGVDCIHYTASSTLGNIYSDVGGAASRFQADLWIARSGDYPVSGIYGFYSAAGSRAASWGFQFDITHVNDPANKVSPPTNVIALPS